MNEFQIQAAYIFKRATLLIGPCTLMLFPGKLIAIGKLYPQLEPIANDNETK